MHSTATMLDEEVTLNRSYFTKMKARTYADILEYSVIFTKYIWCKGGASGSIEYGIHYRLATKALEIRFGVSRHLFLQLVVVRQGWKNHGKNTFGQCFAETCINERCLNMYASSMT